MPPMSAPRPSSTSMSPTDLGLLAFLGLVWGGAFLFFRVAGPEVGPVWAAEVRVGIAALVLAGVAGRSSLAALRGRLVGILVVGALMSAVPFAAIAFATLTLPASLGSVLNATTPLFTALVAAVWLGQRITGRVAVGLAVGLIGVPVAVGLSPLDLGPGTLVAALASLTGAFSYAVGGTYIKRTMGDVPSLALATGQLVSATILLLPVAILSGPPGVPSVGGAVSLLLLGTVSTALAWPLFFRVLGGNGPTAASTVTFIVPVFGIALGALVLGEPVGPGLVAGFGLVLVSLVLVLGIRVGVPTPAGVGRAIRGAATRLATAAGWG